MKKSAAIVAFAGCALAVSTANAELIYGITGSVAGTNLVSFDSATPGALTTIGGLSGVVANHQVTAIDFRPANNTLYAVSVDFVTGTSGQLYSVDLSTGALTTVGSGFALTGNTSGRVSVDFNPTVDRLRIVSGSGQNYRVNPNNGALVLQDTNLAYAAGDVNAGNIAAVVGVAYTNNFAGATTTTLYAWDFNNDRLSTIVPPNAGTLNTVGGAPGFLTADGGVGFDISGVTGTAYFQYQDFNTGAEVFSTMDLATGLTTTVGTFGVNMLDISASIPTPGAASMLGLAGLVALRRRR